MSDVEKAVVFAILMENNEGILGKAPNYVLEKWEAVQRLEHPENLLDALNGAKLIEWRKRWHVSKTNE